LAQEGLYEIGMHALRNWCARKKKNGGKKKWCAIGVHALRMGADM